MRRNLIVVVLLAGLLLQACGAAATPEAIMEKTSEPMMSEKTEAPGAMMEKSPEAMMGPEVTGSPEAMMAKDATATPDAMMAAATPTDGAMMDAMEAPAWFGSILTDVRSGESFSLGDYRGKVVLVEMMAVWCSNCRKQQEQVKALHELMGERDDFLSLGLDIDPNEQAEDLKAFIEAQGFNWQYAVAPAETAREIGNLYGAQFLNPPSTPMLVVDRKGQTHPLPFGIKSAEDLMKALQPFLDEGM